MVRIAAQRKHKYNAQKTLVDGIVFASILEARRYQQLKLLLTSGMISDLDLQPAFELQPKFKDTQSGKSQAAIKYQADFWYIENGFTIVEEVKGFETAIWRLKKKMFLYRYPQYELRILTKDNIG